MKDLLQINGPDRRRPEWHSYEAPYQRRRLVTPWTVGGLGTSLAVVLALAFPRQSIETRLAQSYKNKKPDQLTVGYLEAFLRTDPRSGHLRLKLARELIRLGSLAQARAIIAPLLDSNNPALRSEAVWVDVAILEQDMFAVKDFPVLWSARSEELKARIDALVEDAQEPDDLMRLLSKTRSLRFVEQEFAVLTRMATLLRGISAAQYVEAAHIAVELEKPRAAAVLYFRAMDVSDTTEERRENFFQGLFALRSGGLLDEVIPAADNHLGQLASDSTTLLRLIELARSVNRPDAAQRYALDLVRANKLTANHGDADRYINGARRPQVGAFIARAAWRLASAPPRIFRVGRQDDPKLVNLPFDEQAYETAFSTFLANRDVSDARLLAESAVRQRPDDMKWRKRLAQIDEWNNMQHAALSHWLVYARRSDDPEGWSAVLRLAEALQERAAIQEALTHKIASDPGNPAALLSLARLKAATGDAKGAISLLRTAASGKVDKKTLRDILETMAAVAERSDRQDDLLSALRRMQSEFGQDSGRALRIASVLYQRGDNLGALAAMDAASGAARADDTAFWRNYGQVAILAGSNDVAVRAYTQIIQRDAWNESDITALQEVLQKGNPLAASRVAMFGFEKTGNKRLAFDALALMARAGNTGSAIEFLEAMPAERIEILRKDPAFLSLEAFVQHAAGRTGQADRAIKRAYVLRPNDPDLRSALMWALIASHDMKALRQSMQAWAHDAEDQQQLWGPFAAACMALNRPTDALHWFRKRGFPRNDYLWLMSYAEALDAVGQSDLAWRIRRRAWTGLRDPRTLAKADPDQLAQMRNRIALLAPLFTNADDALRVVQALLRSDVKNLDASVKLPDAPKNGADLIRQVSAINGAETRSAEGNRDRLASPSALFPASAGRKQREDDTLGAGAREVALAWAMSHEANDLARAWLAARYSSQVAKPLWAEFSLVLQSNDKVALKNLLDTAPDWLPTLDRIEAEQRLDRLPSAQSTAFDALDHLPDNDALQTRFTDLVTTQAPAVGADLRSFRQAPLRGTVRSLRAGARVGGNVDVSAEGVESTYSTEDPTQLSPALARDTMLWLVARHRTHTGYVMAGLMLRKADVHSNGARIEWQEEIVRGTTIVATAGWHMPAIESVLLRVGGQRSGAQVNLTQQFTRTEYTRLTLGWQRYASLAGTALGHGTNYTLEAGSSLRTDYPNLVFRAYASGISTSSNGRSDAQIGRHLPPGAAPGSIPFVPDGDTIFGVSVGIGNCIDGTYSRAFRPFAELGMTSSRQAGTGFNGMIGAVGSVFGNDMLRVRVQRISGTTFNPSGFRQIGVDYKWYF
jgi:predicted Zn-dependent protease